MAGESQRQEMRILGIIGGVSWHSTAEYYRQLNKKIETCLGARHSAKLILTSLDFAELLILQREGNEELLRHAFISEGKRLQLSGCEAFIIASHTLNWLGDLIETEVGLRHINMFTPLRTKLNALGVKRVGLVGTRYTMSEVRYHKIYENFGIQVITPNEPHLTQVSSIVYKELVRGIFRPESKEVFQKCFLALLEQGAQAIVLGCTEIGLLIPERMVRIYNQSTSSLMVLPLVDLITPHVNACTEWMIDHR